MVEKPAEGSSGRYGASVSRSGRDAKGSWSFGNSLGGGAPAALRLVACLLPAIAAVWLGYQFWRLVLQPAPLGAVDLRMRCHEVVSWFSGLPVYGLLNNAVYPPASYAMLWPALGWTSLTAARWIWAVLSLLALFQICSLLVRHGGESKAWRGLPALVALASYPVGATIGNGQLGIIVLVCLLASLPLIARRDRSWFQDGCLAALFLVALVKPTLAGFFFWILLFSAGSLRPAMLTCAGYAGLTYVASLFRRAGPIDLMRRWLGQAEVGSAWGAGKGEGSIRLATDAAGAVGTQLQIKSVNLHSLLGFFGQKDQLLVATLLVLALLGLWIFWNRGGSLWVLAGVTALVARFSCYHGWYDDLILLLPLLAVLRISRAQPQPGRLRRFSMLLCIAMSLFLLAPGGSYALPQPWSNFYVVGQAALWLFVLGFLIFMARRVPATGR